MIKSFISLLMLSLLLASGQGTSFGEMFPDESAAILQKYSELDGTGYPNASLPAVDQQDVINSYNDPTIAPPTITPTDPTTPLTWGNLKDMENILDNFSAYFKNSVSPWVFQVKLMALRVFMVLVGLDFAWMVLRMIMVGHSFATVMREMAQKLLLYGIGWYCIFNGDQLMTGIFDLFKFTSLNTAAGADLEPGGFFTGITAIAEGVFTSITSFEKLQLTFAYAKSKVIGGTMWTSPVFLFNLPKIILLILIVLFSAMISALVIISYAKMYLSVTASIVLFGFMGSDWTRGVFKRSMFHALAMGFELFATILIAKLCLQTVNSFSPLAASADFVGMLIVTLVLYVFGLLIFRLPTTLANIVSETALFTGGNSVYTSITSSVTNIVRHGGGAAAWAGSSFKSAQQQAQAANGGSGPAGPWGAPKGSGGGGMGRVATAGFIATAMVKNMGRSAWDTARHKVTGEDDFGVVSRKSAFQKAAFYNDQHAAAKTASDLLAKVGADYTKGFKNTKTHLGGAFHRPVNFFSKGAAKNEAKATRYSSETYSTNRLLQDAKARAGGVNARNKGAFGGETTTQASIAGRNSISEPRTVQTPRGLGSSVLTPAQFDLHNELKRGPVVLKPGQIGFRDVSKLHQATGLEHAVVRLKTGERLLVRGDMHSVSLKGLAVKRLIVHSHHGSDPNASVRASKVDQAALATFGKGQTRSYIVSSGTTGMHAGMHDIGVYTKNTNRPIDYKKSALQSQLRVSHNEASGKITINHKTLGDDVRINGIVTGGKLKVGMMSVTENMRRGGTSIQLIKRLLEEAGPNIQSLTGELEFTNIAAFKKNRETMPQDQAASLTPAGKAATSLGFTQHKYDPIYRMLTSTRPTINLSEKADVKSMNSP